MLIYKNKISPSKCVDNVKKNKRARKWEKRKERTMINEKEWNKILQQRRIKIMTYKENKEGISSYLF